MSTNTTQYQTDKEYGNTQFQNNNYKFQEEYQYWKKAGESHVVARNRAIDYYRKFLKREVTVNWEFIADHVQSDGNHTDDALEGVQFNTVVRRVMADLTPRQKELFCYILVQHDLDRHLDDDLAETVISATSSKRPSEVKEIAGHMGLALNNIGVCTPITANRKRIREVFVRHGFVLGG